MLGKRKGTFVFLLFAGLLAVSQKSSGGPATGHFDTWISFVFSVSLSRCWDGFQVFNLC